MYIPRGGGTRSSQEKKSECVTYRTATVQQDVGDEQDRKEDSEHEQYPCPCIRLREKGKRARRGRAIANNNKRTGVVNPLIYPMRCARFRSHLLLQSTLRYAGGGRRSK